jgi:hypothetical protein
VSFTEFAGNLGGPTQTILSGTGSCRRAVQLCAGKWSTNALLSASESSVGPGPNSGSRVRGHWRDGYAKLPRRLIYEPNLRTWRFSAFGNFGYARHARFDYLFRIVFRF